MASNNTVLVKGRGIRKERPAGEAGIFPGMLVKVNSSGQYIKDPTAAKNCQKTFAVENDMMGVEMGTAYASGDNVLAETLGRGCEVNAFVPANAPAILVGDFLENGGGGTVRKSVANAATADTERTAIVGIALEAVDNSAVGAIDRILIELV